MNSLNMNCCRILAMLATMTVLGSCAGLPTSGGGADDSKTTFYAVYHFYSDPPGAHLYSQCGGYYGVTADTQGARVGIIYSKTSRRSAVKYVTLKKRGYPTTVHYFTIRYEHSNKADARANPNKIVIVLDTE